MAEHDDGVCDGCAVEPAWADALRERVAIKQRRCPKCSGPLTHDEEGVYCARCHPPEEFDPVDFCCITDKDGNTFMHEGKPCPC